MTISPIAGVLTTKRGEQFAVRWDIAASTSVAWTGLVGYCMIRDAADVQLHTFGTVTATINVDGSATIVFQAEKASTSTWVAGDYYIDFSCEIVGSFGPKMTPTYKLKVYDGPTNVP
jgi:hypothetical protein